MSFLQPDIPHEMGDRLTGKRFDLSMELGTAHGQCAANFRYFKINVVQIGQNDIFKFLNKGILLPDYELFGRIGFFKVAVSLL